MPGTVLQANVTTSAAALSSSSIPNKLGIELKALAANSAPVYFGYSDSQLLIYSAGYVPTGGTFDLVIRDLTGAPYTARGLAYNIASATLQAVIRALAASLAAVTVTGTNPLISAGGLTVLFGKQFPTMVGDVTLVTGGTPGTLTSAYTTSLTTSNGFQLAASESYRFAADEVTDASNIWVIAGSSQTVCAALS